MKKLAIVTTHPIQYNAPVFRMLQERNVIAIKVFYTWGEKVLENKYDPGFKRVIDWDIPLLDGYDYVMVNNKSKEPGTHHYKGIINPQLCDEIEIWEPDALLILGWSYQSHFKCLRHFKKNKKVFFWGDSNLLDQSNNPLKKFIRKIFLTWVYSYVDVAFYVGKANKDYYLEYGIKKENMVFVPHAIENERFSTEMKTNFRENLKIDKSKILFLFAGKFEVKKDPLLLLNAFREINNSKTEILFVGNGPLEIELKKTVLSFPEDLRKNIHFLDFQNQSLMPDVYKCCDVFVLPSKGPGETWGLAINEAMASSKPVLVSNKCGAAMDLVQDGINGYVFESGQMNSLIEKMKIFINQREKLMAYGKQSHEIISEWSFQKICLAIESAVIN